MAHIWKFFRSPLSMGPNLSKFIRFHRRLVQLVQSQAHSKAQVFNCFRGNLNFYHRQLAFYTLSAIKNVIRLTVLVNNFINIIKILKIELSNESDIAPIGQICNENEQISKNRGTPENFSNVYHKNLPGLSLRVHPTKRQSDLLVFRSFTKNCFLEQIYSSILLFLSIASIWPLYI